MATHFANRAVDFVSSIAAPGVVDAAVDPNKAIRIARFFSYPKQVLYLLASFIALVSICHFLTLAYTYITRNRVYTRKRTTVSLSRLPIAVVDSLKALTLRWTVPIGPSFTLNLFELFVTLAYMAVLFSWTFVNTTTTTGVKVEPHYYANRAGTIAASQIPIMTALGMRNNLVSWLTGISFDKLNYLHRMSARVIVVLAWIHAGGRVTVGLDEDGPISERWVQCGVVAASTLTLLCMLSIRPVRERHYEAFNIIHSVFAFMFIVAIYLHLAGRNLVYYGPWPAMVVWGLDRFMRFFQLGLYNFAYLNPWSKSSKDLDASVEVLSPHFLKVTLHRSKIFHWRPGQSAFLSFPAVSSLPFESHPVTMSTICDDSSSSANKLVFFLRVRDGFTAKLKDVASPAATYKVFINGPYSSPPILLGYQTVVLIGGGSGVAFTLPLFLDLVRRAKHNKSTCQRVVFIWAIRDAGLLYSTHLQSILSNIILEHIKWIEDALLEALDQLPKSISVTLKFFVTADPEDSPKWSDDSKEDVIADKDGSSHSSESGLRLLESSFVSLEQGRPDLVLSIRDEIANGTGPISINVCGTRTLASTVRRAIRVPRPLDVLRGGPSVTLHVEAFGGY
ncbi:hypothetical protein GALMADRAFT_1202327 [Galerina marginata CBS 339.88]|uniref:FAD-binding FR-type domain-containing protein n=1 Tax=Galerina marginata (strain CBS 339.88) TaxID=685588 RepID=A0A067TBI2_GALM3|nr:hypothetical protein GALMADRAFT_1202327 [Galerina marginata CBS 339.88]